jgi:hypothetical protein
LPLGERHHKCHTTRSLQWFGWPTPGRVTMLKHPPEVVVKAFAK